jgi:hypothetical protein
MPAGRAMTDQCHRIRRQLLTPAEEADVIANLLADPDDVLSMRLLELHYRSLRGSDAK